MNTRGCGAPGRTTHQLAISNQSIRRSCQLKWVVGSLPLIAFHCEPLRLLISVSVTVGIAVVEAERCMLNMSSMPYSARKNAINCTLGKLNNPSINVWHYTDVPLPLDKVQQYIYT